jgi:peptide/nickel transport system substrate-binding protein
VGCRRLEPRRITIAQEGEVIALDPVRVAEALTQSTLSNVYEGLVTFDAEMRVVPALAASWSSPDETTWLFRLRPGVRCHDGRALTAPLAAAALERARSHADSRLRGRLATIRSVSALDDDTLRVATSRPDPMLLNRLAYVLLAPQPGVGTGPYRIASWKRGEPLALEAFDDYWGGRASIDEVRFVSIPEAGGRMSALRDRSVDLLRWVPEARLAEAGKAAGFRVASRAGLVSYYLWFDSRRATGGPFADPRVRRAVSLAVDRARLVADLGGRAEPLDQVVPQGVFGHVAGLAGARFDPEAARRLLAEAGHPNGLDVTLTLSPGASTEAVRASLGGMLARVGIRATIVVPEWSALMADLEAGRVAFYLLGWRLETGEASTFLHDCLHSRGAGAGGCNPGYSNPVLDRLLDETEAIGEDQRRLERFREVTVAVMEDAPLVPLYRQADQYAVSSRLRWSPRLDGKLLAASMALEPGS